MFIFFLLKCNFLKFIFGSQPYLPKNGSTLDVSIDREYKGVGLISGGITSGWFLGKTTPRSYRHKWLYEGLNKYAEYLLTSQVRF